MSGNNTKIVAVVAVILVAILAVAAVVVLTSNTNNSGDGGKGGDAPGVYEDGLVTKSDLVKIQETAKKNSNYTLEVDATNGKVVFDNAAVLSLSSAAKLHMDKVDTSTLDESTKAIVGSRPIYDISFGNNTDFGSGKATVSVAYTPISGEDTSKLVIYYLKGDGNYEQVSASYANGYVTFSVSHFSKYAVMSSKTCTVTFKVDDTIFKTEQVAYGTYVKAPADSPTKAGKYFCGWTGLSENTVAFTDMAFNAYFSDSSAKVDAGKFVYGGVFGEYSLVASSTDAASVMQSKNAYTANPTNDIHWAVESDASAAYSSLSAAMTRLSEIQGAKPVELCVKGVENITAYKVDVDGASVFTVLYFVAYKGDVVVYAMDDSDSPDRYSGVMALGALATDDEIKELVTAALVSIDEDGSIVIGSAKNLADAFVATYKEGTFGTYTVTSTSTSAVATASGNGNISWEITPTGSAQFDSAISALKATAGMEVVKTKGNDKAALYMNGSKVYFVAYSDNYYLADFTVNEGTVSGGFDAGTASTAEILDLVNCALRTFTTGIKTDASASMIDAANWFLDNYVDAYDKSVWSLLSTSTDSKATLHLHFTSGKTKTRDVDLVLSIESDIDAAYAEAVKAVNGHIGEKNAMGSAFSALDYAIEGIEYTATVYHNTSSGQYMFAMKVGNYLVNGSCPETSKDSPAPSEEGTATVPVQGSKFFYIYKTGDDAQNAEFARFLGVLKEAVVNHSGGSSKDINVAEGAAKFVETHVEPEKGNKWSVVESDKDSATLRADYSTSGGARAVDIYVKKSDNVGEEYYALSNTVAALNGTTFLKTTTYSTYSEPIEGVTYTAVAYIGSKSICAVRFAICVGDIIIDASITASGSANPSDYPYIYIYGTDDVGKGMINTLIAELNAAFS